MAIFQQGVVNSTKSILNSSSPNQDRLNKTIKELNSSYILARVTDIILNNSHPEFNNVGQWSGIGAILFESYTANQPIEPVSSYALPCSSILRYPLINEIVTLIKSPGKGYSSNNSKEQYYYLSPIQIWNTPNQNSNPILPTSNLLNNNYSSNNNGKIIQENNEPFQANLNSPTNSSQEKFIEKSNIRSLSPQMGDTIIEGRNGQSIRFSNNESNPITFIRNGQNRTTPSSGFEPISEDIKNDLSSIYLTSYQKISNLNLETEKGIPFISYSTPPITPSQFNQPQVVLNSDRIIIEAETDSVLVSAGKSVGLFSNESINIESKDINIHTDNKIRLGSKNAGESVLLGDKTYDIIEFTLNMLQILADTLAPSQIYPTGAPIPDASTQAITTTLSEAIKTVKEKVLVNIKSNKVKVE